MKTYLTSKPELEMSLEEALALQVKLSEAIQKVVTSRLDNPSQVISMPTILTENKGHNAAGVVIISITRRPEDLLQHKG